MQTVKSMFLQISLQHYEYYLEMSKMTELGEILLKVELTLEVKSALSTHPTAVSMVIPKSITLYPKLWP